MTSAREVEPRRIFLVRHGQSEANKDESLHFSPEKFAQHVALTPLGHRQALACGKRLAKLVGDDSYAAFLSPYLRTRQTWAGIRKEAKKLPRRVTVDGRLREQEYKDVTNKDEYEYKRRRAQERGKLYYRYTNGESGYDVLNRVGNFYNQIRFDMHAGSLPGTVVVVCHEVVIRCFLLVALGLDPMHYERLNFRNCQIVELRGDARLQFERGE